MLIYIFCNSFSCFHNTSTATDMYERENQETSIANITSSRKRASSSVKTDIISYKQSESRVRNGQKPMNKKQEPTLYTGTPTLFGDYIHMSHPTVFCFAKHGFDIGIAPERNFVVVRVDPFKMNDFASANRSS